MIICVVKHNDLAHTLATSEIEALLAFFGRTDKQYFLHSWGSSFAPKTDSLDTIGKGFPNTHSSHRHLRIEKPPTLHPHTHIHSSMIHYRGRRPTSPGGNSLSLFLPQYHSYKAQTRYFTMRFRSG